ncbi:DUF4118 domain-containing protein [Streptomyces sp. NPDC048606]|uniref:DUF4118 domain-containing protein n=1 Tax=Streptomyces sp. NPDC048606 TaxID=3154726 RepID=UPI0034310318
MLEWKPLDTGRRPVPDPAATVSVWASAAAAALLVVIAFNLLGHQSLTTAGLLVLSLMVAAASTGARLAAAPGTALLCWAVLNAFGAPPIGELTWTAPHDLARIACLLTAAATGTAAARLSHARAAYHRLAP